MFCNKCGKKLSGREGVCKNCGTPAEYEQYCGGFHGLVKEEPALERMAYGDHMAASNSCENRLKEEEEEKMKRNTLILFSIFFGVLMIVIAMMAWVIIDISKQQDGIVDKQVQIEENVADLYDQNEKMLHYQSGQHGADGNSDGICDGCGDCLHLVPLEDHVSNGNEMHSVVTVCGTCGLELSRYDDRCVDKVNENTDATCPKDLKCDICGGAVTCMHENTAYKRAVDTTEVIHDAVCLECETVLETVDCTAGDDPAVCSVCGECMHNDTEQRYDKIPTSGDTHNNVEACVSCGKVIVSNEDKCIDQDGSDGKCDLCNGKIVLSATCDHEDTQWKVDNGQHTEVCETCGEDIGEPEPCVDEDADESCDRCGEKFMKIA